MLSLLAKAAEKGGRRSFLFSPTSAALRPAQSAAQVGVKRRASFPAQAAEQRANKKANSVTPKSVGINDVAGRTTREGCDFEGWHSQMKSQKKAQTTCCKQGCHQFYTNDLIYRLRGVVVSKSSAAQKFMLQARVGLRSDAAEEAVAGEGTRRNNEYWLESATRLEERVERAERHHRPLDSFRPADSEASTSVCVRMLLFAFGVKSTEWLYTKPYVADVGQNARRIKKKDLFIHRWFGDARTRYLVLPNTPFTILPFRSKFQTHAAYIGDHEKDFARQRAEEAERRGGEEEEEDNEADDEGALLDPHGVAMRTVKLDEGMNVKYRYGNPELGLKDPARPEDPHLASAPYFNAVWRADSRDHTVDPYFKISNVKTRKWIPFAKCPECVALRKEQVDCHCPKRCREVATEHKAHLKFIHGERQAYYGNRSLSWNQPTLHATITIDGADQADFHLPHYAEADKMESSAFKLKTHVVGALIHGRPPMCFISGNQCKQGHNVTIQAFWECLVELHGSRTGIPPNITLQLDNTTKQNKGKWLIAFCEILVARKVCQKITINFLPVGHTHEDIDQFFSRIATRLRQRDALSLPALAEVIKSSYKSKGGFRPIVREWESLANISGWLGEMGATDFPNVTKFRCFRITADIHGTPKVEVRNNMADGGMDDEFRGPRDRDLGHPEADFSCWASQGGRVPDILAKHASGRSRVPDAQRSEPLHDRAEKYVKGMEKLEKLPEAMYPSKDKIANRGLLTIEFSKDWAIPFDWDEENLKAILGKAQGQEPPPPEADAPAEPPKRTKPALTNVAIGNTYIVEAFDDDNYPFYIAKVRDTGDPGDEAAWLVQFHEPADAQNGKDFTTIEQFIVCTYQTEGTDGNRTGWSRLTNAEFLEEVHFKGAGGKGKFQIKEKGKASARAWGRHLAPKKESAVQQH
jgi:hypothetical protein